MQHLWEQEIIQWIGEKINYCRVGAFPENATKFVEHKIGDVLVRYSGIKWRQEDVSNSYQTGKVSIEIVLLFRKLRGKQGLYETMDDIRASLYNRRPTKSVGAGIQFESEDLLDVERGIWQYGVKLSFDCMWIPTQSSGTPATSITASADFNPCGS